ncbi:helix-turn-helix domain-containing protein [Magnetospirillum sp. ME-1]|uniref:helix-turn-helix domain-containing protein n=1 Tax=Magnetospirillum sp. ME-1 TaxID=1639348 RepID=UPI000A197185
MLDLIPTPEACKYLDISRATLTRIVGRGELRAIKIGKTLRFRVSDLDAWVDSRPYVQGGPRHADA